MSAPRVNLFGRTVIETYEAEITRENVLDVLRASLIHHNMNRQDIEYLRNYYRGKQPILNRIKRVRPEINNRIVENHAVEIVDFKRGYIFGEPVQYVRRGEGAGVSEKITELNGYMSMQDKASKDHELAESFYVCGTGYRMVLPKENPTEDESPFEFDVLDPRDTFVVYSNDFGRKPMMGVKYVRDEDGEKVYSIYTKDAYFEVYEDTILSESINPLGDIPIIEYPANVSRLGAFEPVITILDALNNIASNRMDGIEQFVQSFMKFINCEITKEEFLEFKELGAIKIKGEPGNPADVALVSNELNQTQVQVSKADLYQMVLIVCGMPDRNVQTRAAGDTGQAVMLRDGWSAAESRARDTELMFKRSEKRFLKLVLKILRDLNRLDLRLTDIDIKFSRNKTDNLLVKTQGLQNMLEAGVHPQIAISHVGLFNDPEQTYLDSEEYLKKWLMSEANVTPGNNKSYDAEVVS